MDKLIISGESYEIIQDRFSKGVNPSVVIAHTIYFVALIETILEGSKQLSFRQRMGSGITGLGLCYNDKKGHAQFKIMESLYKVIFYYKSYFKENDTILRKIETQLREYFKLKIDYGAYQGLTTHIIGDIDGYLNYFLYDKLNYIKEGVKESCLRCPPHTYNNVLIVGMYIESKILEIMFFSSDIRVQDYTDLTSMIQIASKSKDPFKDSNLIKPLTDATPLQIDILKKKG